MSEKQRETLTRWADLCYKFGVPVGLAALFFLKSSFATRPELDELNNRMTERVTAIEKTLAVMVEQNLTNERQDARLFDHEQRLRALEAKR